MLIGSQYADNKIYRGIRHYDKMPLTSEDIHEYSDTAYMKNAYIMNNLLGYGPINSPDISITDEGVKIIEPAVIMIDGDIALIQSDQDAPLVSNSEITAADYSEGVVCIIGWYQHIRASSTIKSYGGVNNTTLENDLLNEHFQLQLSSRYQFRWFPVIVEKDKYLQESIEVSISDRSKEGDLLETTSTLSSLEKKNNVFILEKPQSMDYAESNLYLVPLISYKYDSQESVVTETKNYDKLSTGSNFLISDNEPEGTYSDGTEWYNPITQEFKKYVTGKGFISSTSKMAFLQYQSIYVIEDTVSIPQDIVIPVGISELSENSILQVVYEGIVLVNEENYTINYDENTITLLGFTTTEGDHIYFTLTQIVEASNITNMTQVLSQHMNTTGSNVVEGHIKLSDTLSDSDASGGIAATPKMVKDSKLIIDDSSNISYKLGIDNGLLYIEEV